MAGTAVITRRKFTADVPAEPFSAAICVGFSLPIPRYLPDIRASESYFRLGRNQYPVIAGAFSMRTAILGRPAGRLQSILGLVVLCGLTLSLAGCGSNSEPSGVTVTASASTVDGTDSVTLTATVTKDKNAAGVTWSVSGGGTLSNQTTTSATYTAPSATGSAQSITVTATSVADKVKTGTATLTVPAMPSITTTTLIAGAVGTSYSQSLAASGGIPPYTWALTSGTLPSCLTFTQSSSGATIAGTPNASCAGTYNNLAFKVTDSGKSTALSATSASLSLVIAAAPTIALPAPAALPSATYNVAYTGSVAATGGAGALTYGVTAGALPTGLSLNTATGAITGTPTSATTFSFTVTAADGFGDSSSQAYSIAVSYPGLKVAAATLPAGYVGSTYPTTALAATGGSGTGYTWALANGSALPAGLTLSAAGSISGKPSGAAGTTNFSVVVTDSASNTANGSFSITVNAGVSITTATTLPAGYVGSSYSQQLAATGGSGAGYAWAVSNGSSLPGGLTLTSGGLLSGKPTTAGTPSFSITVTDSAQNTASATFTVTISPGVTIGAATLPVGYPGTSYPSTTLTATGGTGTGYTWSWAAASGSNLPPGLTLSASGAITGTPTNAGTTATISNVVVTATDSGGNTGTANFSITIDATLAISTGATLPTAVVNTVYSQQLGATGGSGGYTWSTNAAGTTSLAGVSLVLSAAGLVSGTPAATGSASFAAVVADNGGHTATVTFTVTVTNALTITTTSLPAAYTNTLYSQTLTASGGTGAGYTWSTTGTSNLATFNLTLSAAGVLSGTPAAAGTASFTAQVKDSGGNIATQALTVTVNAPLALPSPNPGSLGSATVNQAYSGTINASGGVAPYTWTINGTTVPGTGLALTNGLSASNNGTGTLAITGTPTATGSVTIASVIVKDSTNATAGPFTYTVTVNSAGSAVSGQISFANNCGNPALPSFTVSINTNPVQTTTTDGSGNYSFASVPNGTYTITPSITGPSSVFYPATQSVTVNNGPVTAGPFQVALGYTVSGTVSYAGTKTGQVYLELNSTSCGGNNPNGTSFTDAVLTSGGAFTIRGVPPGPYGLQAWMDTIGQGVSNATDPTGTVASVTVATADVTGVAVTLTDPTVTTPTSGPVIYSVTPANDGAVISYGAIPNNNGVEAVTGYTVEWSTTPTFTSTSSYFYKAISGNVWILNNGLANMTGTLTNGTAYYFRARGELSNATVHTPWTVFGGATPTAVTVGAPSGSGYNTVSGTVTIPAAITPTGPLYVGFYNQSTGAVYGTAIASPSNSSPNSYTVSVPSGTGYFFYGILDQNNDGEIDAGDVTNTRGNNGSAGVTISGNLTADDLTLPSANSIVQVTTQYFQQTSPNGSSTGYDIGFDLREGNKLPVSVTLASASNPDVITPTDIGNCASNCGSPQWQYYASIGGDVPNVGDTYTFDVTYSDGSTGAITGTVTAVLNAGNAVTNLAPTVNSSTSTTPTFTWTDPANASNYTYQFYLNDNNGNTIWQIPGNNSNLNGFASSITSITWGTDPTGDTGNTPSVGSLTPGTTYNWQIQVQDSNGNQAQTQVYYIP